VWTNGHCANPPPPPPPPPCGSITTRANCTAQHGRCAWNATSAHCSRPPLPPPPPPPPPFVPPGPVRWMDDLEFIVSVSGAPPSPSHVAPIRQ
jgi:hypothetical protein